MTYTDTADAYIPVKEDFTFVRQKEEEIFDDVSSGGNSFLRDAFLKFVSKKGNVAAVIVLGLLIIMSLIGPAT